MLLLAMTLTVAIGCGGSSACTLESRWGLVVIVRDAATGAVRCDARVTIADGEYRETLSAGPVVGAESSVPCNYAGAGRPGTYRVQVTTDSGSKTLAGIVVPAAPRCQVDTQDVTIEL
jgi:hypothetical protein